MEADLPIFFPSAIICCCYLLAVAFFVLGGRCSKLPRAFLDHHLDDAIVLVARVQEFCSSPPQELHDGAWSPECKLPDPLHVCLPLNHAGSGGAIAAAAAALEKVCPCLHVAQLLVPVHVKLVHPLQEVGKLYDLQKAHTCI